MVFFGVIAYKQKGRQQDRVEAGVELKGSPGEPWPALWGSLGLALPVTYLHWKELARPSCRHLAVSLFPVLQG